MKWLIVGDLVVILIMIVFCIVLGIFLGSPLSFPSILGLVTLFAFIVKLGGWYIRLLPKSAKKLLSDWEVHRTTRI